MKNKVIEHKIAVKIQRLLNASDAIKLTCMLDEYKNCATWQSVAITLEKEAHSVWRNAGHEDIITPALRFKVKVVTNAHKHPDAGVNETELDYDWACSIQDQD